MVSGDQSPFAPSMEERVNRTLARAYKKARNTDEADIRYLKKMGVLLPNGLTPHPPLFDVYGEELLASMKNYNNSIL